MIITKTKIPEGSILNSGNMQYDYFDAFQSKFINKNQNLGITEIGKYFFSGGPNWIELLFVFRNWVVGLLGLKTAGKNVVRQKLFENILFEKGDKIGLFKVFEKTENELILGEDDKHLNFRVSLFLDKFDATNADSSLTISTTVKFNNWFGRLYFIPVKPFHKIIVPTMLKGIINKIDA